MVKLFKQIIIGVLALIGVATTSVALADTYITPVVGYQFQTNNVVDKQVATIGEYQKNHATYGIQVLGDAKFVGDKTKLGVEYLRTDSNIDSYNVGVIGQQRFTDTGVLKHFYTTGGVGYNQVSGSYKNQEGAYFTVGGGIQYPLTNMITLTTEVRTDYLTQENQWIPKALVGFQFNTSEFGKPYSK